MTKQNPFITTGYAGPEYFCDRVEETQQLIKWLTNGNNVALISPRRYGKTDLIRHCFAQPTIKRDYYTFIIDIYAAKTFEDVVKMMSLSIVRQLKPKGQKAMDTFLSFLQSIRPNISFDYMGNPSFSLSQGEIRTPETTLSELFQYLQSAEKPCLVAIDEFQQICKIKDEHVEALFRTQVQYCSNANFVFSGSQRHLMGEMFTTSEHPFYQSATIFELKRLPKEKYIAFAETLFQQSKLTLEKGVVESVYDRFNGITYYMQRVMNELYADADSSAPCTLTDVDIAIQHILSAMSIVYENLMYQLPDKQAQVLRAIANEGQATNLTSGRFVNKHGLVSPNSIKAAIPALLEKDLITSNQGVYQLYDKFLELWINQL